jgi:amidohydrolase
MVKEGCCQNPDVDYTIGLHVQPYMDVGTVEMRYGQLNASCDTVTIKVKGKAGHGAYPERGVDAIVAAAGIVSGLQTFVSRNISPLNNAVLTIGTINGGTKSNIVADEVKMTGTLRTLDPETRVFAKDRITALAEGIAQGYGCTAEVDVEWGYACLINTDEVVDVMKARSEELLGADHVLMKQFPSLGGEDFSYFIDGSKKGGAFYHLGCGKTAKGITAALHNQQFDVDEDCIPLGIQLQMTFLMDLLQK